MKIIIAGASDVGLHLAKLLSFESQDITLIDSVKEQLNYAETHLDIRAIHGDPSALARQQRGCHRRLGCEFTELRPESLTHEHQLQEHQSRTHHGNP